MRSTYIHTHEWSVFKLYTHWRISCRSSSAEFAQTNNKYCKERQVYKPASVPVHKTVEVPKLLGGGRVGKKCECYEDELSLVQVLHNADPKCALASPGPDYRLLKIKLCHDIGRSHACVLSASPPLRCHARAVP